MGDGKRGRGRRHVKCAFPKSDEKFMMPCDPQDVPCKSKNPFYVEKCVEPARMSGVCGGWGVVVEGKLVSSH